jgi:hypothetical protein
LATLDHRETGNSTSVGGLPHCASFGGSRPRYFRHRRTWHRDRLAGNRKMVLYVVLASICLQRNSAAAQTTSRTGLAYASAHHSCDVDDASGPVRHHCARKKFGGQDWRKRARAPSIFELYIIASAPSSPSATLLTRPNKGSNSLRVDGRSRESRQFAKIERYEVECPAPIAFCFSGCGGHAFTISSRNRDDAIPGANKLSYNGKTEAPATTGQSNAAHALTPMFGRARFRYP